MVPLIFGTGALGVWKAYEWVEEGREDALFSGSSGGVIQPLPPGAPLSIGSVRLHNISDSNVELLSARIVHKDPAVRVLGYAAHPTDFAPLTELNWPLSRAVPIDEWPALVPDAEDRPQVVIIVGLDVPEGEAGKAVGVAVKYRHDGHVKEQVFEEMYYVCSVPVFDDAECAGFDNMFEVFGDFEDEVRGESEFVIPDVVGVAGPGRDDDYDR